eukprot:GHVQ01029000.1.p1 GENE.GHVQ01029000.1~~GHVQ01029000.1.p1  ORF type:complete len:196 (+),score=25.12 GHVQ01029000.1:187-774(+)
MTSSYPLQGSSNPQLVIGSPQYQQCSSPIDKRNCRPPLQLSTWELSEEQLAELQRMCFQLFDNQGCGTVPAKHIGLMLRSLGQVWSYKELLELEEKYQSGIQLEQFRKVARNGQAHRAGIAGNSEALAEIESAYHVLSREVLDIVLCRDLQHVITSVGDKLTNSDVHSLLQAVDMKQIPVAFSFNEFVCFFTKGL